MFVQIAEARIQHYKWDVMYEYKCPDCYKKLAITSKLAIFQPFLDSVNQVRELKKRESIDS
jgi:hypothetical protein